MRELHFHTFEPVFDSNSRILILGTFPSVKSRESGFYYGHPQNRFWRVMAKLLSQPVPCSIEEKKQLLIQNRVALWDVAASCEIEGSSDSSMTRVVPNDIPKLLSESKITHVFANGKKAAQLYNRLIYPVTELEIVTLPSTSPANADCGMENLLREWQVILPLLT